MTYKVSIIIPVYNASDYIMNALKSIENQTMNFEDIEVVLVNDCSTDNTVDIINEYKSKHDNIVLINLNENAGGPAIPRNIGITYASADYLMFLDQDDTFKSNACEVLYNKISGENVDVVCGNHNIVVNGVARPVFNFDSWAKEDEIKINSIDENPNFLSIGTTAWSKIFRKSLVLDNNIKFVEGVSEDTLFCVRSLLLARGIILLKDFIVVDYQYRTDSLSHIIDAEYVNEFTDFYLEFYDYCDANITNSLLYQPLFNGRMDSVLSVLFYADVYYDELSDIFVKIKDLFGKLNSKGFKFNNTEYQLLFNTVLSDTYPFKMSIMMYTTIRSNREEKFDSSVKYLRQFTKLYVDCGSGFNEKDSLTQEYRIAEENVVEFDISNFKNIKAIRFDPIAWYFIRCRIIDITSDAGSVDILPHNAVSSVNNMDNFLTTDSQYRIYGDFNDNTRYIRIRFHIDLLDNARITEIVEQINN